ncbi:UDP-glucose 4-epimerase GalE [Synechococcus sp. RSCCF101]|uniref:UDP-glucose 4-epimerase GalE n=1 Tax=Synechococcus sp. RSCCF101 TaxID=2511069 RepID=UPI0012471FA6|nr:UDP-glucose 4-epimerase GalE [Synechococcus sp. RSCCF101]QEY32421.1 UDP-glucose 4-epimerase GalE [Synechococcus sp. RSCCF101]
MATVLITGGAGFIGSHTCLVLLQAGHRLVILDDFSNSSPRAVERLAELAGLIPTGPGSWGDALRLVQGDIRHDHSLDLAFAAAQSSGPAGLDAPVEAVIHFAGLKAVGESVAEPLRYWDVNLHGSRTLLEAMERHSCRCLVFSSSATLYGYPETVPIPETAPVQPINPYGHTKAAVEMLLADVAGCGAGATAEMESPNGWRIARLRYFNPVGAHPSGQIGEDPDGIPNNLFPFVSQVAVGRRPSLRVFGSDWPTPDGTGVRDYIHVMDLAEGHRMALEALLAEEPQLLTLNLGSGRGISVLEVARAFEAASGRPIPVELVARRPGDAAVTVADPALAARRLGWRTQLGLDAICRDGWAWQSANPHGYAA